MRIRGWASVPAGLVVLAVLAVLTSCGPNAILQPRANVRPRIELTRAPENQTTRFEYAYRMNWLGYDPDGRVEYYRYAVDPPAPTPLQPIPDSAWIRTDRNEALLRFSATRPDSSRPFENGSSDFHTFVLEAVDNGGAGGVLHSAPLVRSFFSYTIAPTVQILTPPGSDRGRTYVAPAVRISWVGFDEDGLLHNQKPVQYKYVLLSHQTRVKYSTAKMYPDSVGIVYAPLHWADWDSVGGDTTFVQYTDLVPGRDYMFVVIAIDEAGAYSPVFNLNTNMLDMRATYAAQSGPLLTLFSDIFFYTYNPSVRDPSPQYQIPVEIAEGTPLSIEWIATPTPGTSVVGYRWGLDLEDINDYTPRNPESTDLRHWSELSNSTQATVGPFAAGETHLFYVEAEDNTGLRALGTVRLEVVGAPRDRELLVVNDTRYVVDEMPIGGNCVGAPKGRWPYAAELDTFLFARGGFPWRCYPPGTRTTPGLLAGYAFDTTGTRTGQRVVRVPLAVLGRYRHVVWLTDSRGGYYDGVGTNIATSIGALRYMSEFGRANSLAAYLQLGGEAWVAGGGAAYAMMFPYNRKLNDTTNPAPGVTFSNRAGELVPGRFMHDVFHWQSEIKVTTAPLQITRTRGRFDAPGRSVPAQYQRLPATLRAKSAALGDAFPPNRQVIPGNFYVTNFDLEYLSMANFVREDVDPDVLVVDEQSTLDTLYRAAGPSLVPPAFNAQNVCMTRYTGPANTHVIFTGFNVWHFTRADCKALVDAVLQDFWQLPYVPPATLPAPPMVAVRPAGDPAAGGSEESPVGEAPVRRTARGRDSR